MQKNNGTNKEEIGRSFSTQKGTTIKQEIHWGCAREKHAGNSEAGFGEDAVSVEINNESCRSDWKHC